MRKKIDSFSSFGLLALVVVFGLSSCRKELSLENKGKAYFKGYGCATCHQIAGVGGDLGPDLTYVGFRKTAEWLDLWLKNPKAWKKNSVMPDFHLSEPARKAMVAYLAALQGQDFTKKGIPWDKEELKNDPVARGKVIFNRVGCTGCHGKNGGGGYPNNNVAGGLISALTKVSEGYSKEELKDRIKNGKISDKEDPNGSEPMIQMPKWGEALKEDELDALVEYLFSLKPASASGDEW